MFHPSGPNFLLSWRKKITFFCSSFDLFCSSLEFSLELEIDFLSLWRKAAGFKTTQTTKLGSVELSCTNVETVSTEREANFQFWNPAKQRHLIQLKIRYYSKNISLQSFHLNNCVQESNRIQQNWPCWLVAETDMLLLDNRVHFIFFRHFCYF